MKFLCLDCDEVMEFAERQIPETERSPRYSSADRATARWRCSPTRWRHNWSPAWA